MAASEIAAILLKRAAEWFFPSSLYCMACGNLIDETRPYALCDTCARRFVWVVGKSCEKCGKPLDDASDATLCADCETGERRFEKGFACVRYAESRAVVHGFKYGGRAYYGEMLARIMYDRIRRETLASPADVMTAVPMHRLKERRRGYNQADVVGKLLARKLGLPYDGRLLTRTRETEAMSGLNAGKRAENASGAFSVARGKEAFVAGKRVLIADDVFTTGSTTDACAAALTDAGAASVRFVVFAAGADARRGN